MIKFSLLLLLVTQLAFSQTPGQDPKLQRLLENTLKGFNGDAGVYVHHLKSGKFAAINADTTFPTASLIKVPIMAGVFDAIRNNKLSYKQDLVYRDSIKYDNGVVGSLKDSTVISVSKVIMLMETISDNTASLWLQGIVGGTRINELMDSLGLQKTRVNSRTKGREAFRSVYGWGQTTPREMATLMEKIRLGQLYSPDASDKMYRILGRQFFEEEGLSQIPASIKTASKTGAVNQSRSEVTFVHAPHGEYVYCIITKNQKDASWVRSNEGYELIRKVSSVLWHYFEPKSGWRPVEGYEKW